MVHLKMMVQTPQVSLPSSPNNFQGSMASGPRDTPGTFNRNTTFIHHLPHIIRGIHEGLHRSPSRARGRQNGVFFFRLQKRDQRVGCFFFLVGGLKNMLVKMEIFTQVGVKIENISNHHLVMLGTPATPRKINIFYLKITGLKRKNI